MHESVYSFVSEVVQGHGQHRAGRVLEAGSLDINGSVRPLFPEASEYVGVDVAVGKGVDWNGWFSEYPCDGNFDVVVSTEMLEHDPFWESTLPRMVDHLKPGGLLILTCASLARGEHGTANSGPNDSPAISQMEKYCNHYKGLAAEDIEKKLNGMEKIDARDAGIDTQVWGIK